MDDHETELLDAVRAAVRETGFDPEREGEEGVHLVRHPRGVMGGWMPVEIDELHARMTKINPLRARARHVARRPADLLGQFVEPPERPARSPQ
ncbi:hypothetical protein ACIQU4_25570 [Streptomyces sp. NPDC090741]|uniref:hypothetical protein n=1 Tax=Streptomyces sp. NPDC090741 TaxID=3365967 RepID=UPI003814BFBE